jgi:hypothetical protein
MKKEIKEKIINIICAILFLTGSYWLIIDAGILKLLAWAFIFGASMLLMLNAEKNYGL